ncbi:MAG: diadenylate cyclase CdaA [Clostridia bacterium]|nr:diadenylate cyclase CdaA [Clostridia bacterium]
MTFYSAISEFFNEIKNALLSFNGISDILDIIFVAFILYAAIKLIRDTKAIQLAKGFIVLIVVYAVVNLLHMEVTSYIFSLVFSNLLLVLVVIFSPEIRHALESVGRSSVSKIGLFSIKNSEAILNQDKANKMIDAVSRACSDMSDEKIGALIVIEKETLLGQIIETGTTVDAEITPEILGNIFFPKAPLHDGAAIIRNYRICAAGCILPLTKNNSDVSSALGTRHRAAIGMSEQSDALVIVVSEETGSISVAEKGRLKRDISGGDLRELLTEQFSLEVEEKGLLKNIRKGRK